MHWKEGEGVWRARRRRVAAANDGHVPPYATAAGGAAIEAEIEESKPRARLTAPEDPTQVSADRVRRDGARAARRACRHRDRRRRGGRRRRRRLRRATTPPTCSPRTSCSRTTRRRQAQATAQQAPREAIAMGLLAWAMMGIAIWHFAIFIPDRFWARHRRQLRLRADRRGHRRLRRLRASTSPARTRSSSRPRSRRSPARCSASASPTGSACARATSRSSSRRGVGVAPRAALAAPGGPRLADSGAIAAARPAGRRARRASSLDGHPPLGRCAARTRLRARAFRPVRRLGCARGGAAARHSCRAGSGVRAARA